MQRNAGDYVKSWGAALIRGAATNPGVYIGPLDNLKKKSFLSNLNCLKHLYIRRGGCHWYLSSK